MSTSSDILELETILETDRDIRRKATTIAIIISLFWICLFFIPLFLKNFPTPQHGGILLVFGDDQEGGAGQIIQVDERKVSEETAKTTAPDQREDADTEHQEQTKTQENTEVVPEEEASIALEEIEKEEQLNPQQDSERKEQDELDQTGSKLEKERLARLEAERAKKLKEQQEAAAAKAEFSDLFKGSGEGTQQGKPGNPLGDLDAEAMEGLTKGLTKMGQGLDERGVVFEPEISEYSQKVGRIVVRVCVDAAGKVIESKYTQKGSTSADLSLIKVAERAAREFVFTSSTVEQQCGNIIVDFKVQ